ncbi:2,3,4,5-tetrahydropyridine-2,6-carboxylate N-succinyltransferase [Pelagivirga sediminicola]|uniref:2,3,4,5-tetrahydropyridine-2,6-carboxylate N-succinyltransferase n=1 Tax=Pelagivirga sediminicola TaxID=2170575 RepID=A0A2T7G790_9RHOB|nr:Hint domain-containing protein [Pelagivirga sediminicola]PVA10282.1 2,3,4,5-tetrahydropyridine-2,6-carboxylate N-succinyltransferase [Pelagivirga sediminicola]
MVAGREIPINTNASAMQMAQEIFGPGVTIEGASYTGDNDSSGIYSNGDTISPGVMPGNTGVMFSTGDLSGFTGSRPSWWGGSNTSTSQTTSSDGPNGVADFNAAAGAPTYDASFIDVDFTPAGDMLTMRFVFASEEYPEYAVGAFQDFVGVWINGQQVQLSVGDGDVDPNNLNAGANGNLFIDNSNDQYNTEMDGFTVSLTLKIPVNAGTTNSIRIGIADVRDANYDSTLIIAGGSVQGTVLATDDATRLDPQGSKTLDVLANDVNNGAGSLTITHINGQAVSPGNTVTLNSGQTVQLNADGTLGLVGDGDTEEFNFTYTVENGSGVSDIGFVLVDSVPCFVAGTMIRTPEGQRPVETLKPGDLVMTRDDGAQPVRWTGRRTIAAAGDFAPIHIAANTFGRHRSLALSPLHRVLIRDALAELLFGEREVLVAARDLVNDSSVRRIEGGEVEYVHILFDRHQLVFSEGLETESFLPGPQTANSFEAEIVEEICAIFPELCPKTGRGYSPAARRTLKRFEAHLLMSAGQAA